MIIQINFGSDVDQEIKALTVWCPIQNHLAAHFQTKFLFLFALECFFFESNVFIVAVNVLRAG